MFTYLSMESVSERSPGLRPRTYLTTRIHESRTSLLQHPEKNAGIIRKNKTYNETLSCMCTVSEDSYENKDEDMLSFFNFHEHLLLSQSSLQTSVTTPFRRLPQIFSGGRQTGTVTVICEKFWVTIGSYSLCLEESVVGLYIRPCDGRGWGLRQCFLRLYQ